MSERPLRINLKPEKPLKALMDSIREAKKYGTFSIEETEELYLLEVILKLLEEYELDRELEKSLEYYFEVGKEFGESHKEFHKAMRNSDFFSKGKGLWDMLLYQFIHVSRVLSTLLKKIYVDPTREDSIVIETKTEVN